MVSTKVILVLGARPQFIKSAPVIRAILTKHAHIKLSIVHSGQHYDPQMSGIFLRELKIPKPVANLEAGSGSHAAQTATIMRRLEDTILKINPDVVLVPGDTNTTLAASLTAAKLGVPVAHIEAGLRSGDFTMPEEINRKLTDHCSTLLFAPTRTAVRNLRREGLRRGVHLTGDTMVDALRQALPFVKRTEDLTLAGFELQAGSYVMVTLHRPSNVDDAPRLRQIVLALRKVARKLPVIFPVHPRTKHRLANLKATQLSHHAALSITSPRGYIETLALLKNASCLLTDSGGMQKEAFLLHIPCITLRPNTEWPETLTAKANRLITNPESIPSTVLACAIDRALKQRIRRLSNPFGPGNASLKIAEILQENF